MTLATRCAACGTAFRVVEDQLKVSDGWVRCGSCNGVFNASENLFHLPDEPRSAVDPTADVGASTGREVAQPSIAEGAQNDPTAAFKQDLAAPEPHVERELEPEAESKQLQGGQELQTERSPEPAAEAPPEPDSAPESEFEAEPPLLARPTSGPAFKTETVAPGEASEHEAERGMDSARPSDDDRAPEAEVGRAADSAFQSTVAITESSALPSSGFGASQPHSAFRDSDAPPDSRIDAHLFKPRRRPATKSLSERDRPDFSDARFDSDLMAYEEDAAVFDAAPEAPVVDPSEAEAHPAPAFLREAERSAHWRRPRVRIALSLGAAALTIVGVLQMAHHFRDAAAVRWPGLRPVLTQWCGIASCTIEPLRRIEAVSVESTGLAKAPGTEAFRLAVGLRNRSSVPIALPWIELSLTDGTGHLVARKALAATEFKPPSPLLQPGADIVLQTLLSARGLQVTGYTVEVFYP